MASMAMPRRVSMARSVGPVASSQPMFTWVRPPDAMLAVYDRPGELFSGSAGVYFEGV